MVEWDNAGSRRQAASGENGGSPAGDAERYITTREAATLLGVNRATVINWARQGRFGAIQYGARGIYRFERKEILDFLNSSRLRFAQDEQLTPNGGGDVGP